MVLAEESMLILSKTQQLEIAWSVFTLSLDTIILRSYFSTQKILVYDHLKTRGIQ